MEALKGNYSTISYCAGDPKETEVIIANGLAFNAFARLGHALRQARHFWKNKHHSEELLWVDQICINQSNPKERAHQVNFMGDIYANAKQVLVSLSTEKDQTGGLSWLSRYSSIIVHSRLEWNDVQNHEPMINPWGEPQSTYFHVGWDAFIATILRSPWWSRAWIRQEFVLLAQTYFMASFEYMHWELLAPAIEACRDVLYRPTRVNPNPRSNLFPDMTVKSPCGQSDCFACATRNSKVAFQENKRRAERLLLAKKRRSTRDERLLSTLFDVHLTKASDPRDLVYACLALSNNHYGVQPNYSKENSFENVLIELSSGIISYYNSLSVLGVAAALHRGRTSFGIPSWVPDWRRSSNGVDHRFNFEEGPSGDEPATNLAQSVAFRDQGEVLHARGEFQEVIPKHIVYRREARYYYLRMSKEKKLHGWEVQEGDEVWMLYGADNLYVFRRVREYYEIVDEVLGSDGILPEVPALIEKVVKLTEVNDPSIRTIQIW